MIPLTPYDITAEDFTVQGDRDNIEVLEDTQPLPRIIEHFVLKGRERMLRSWLSRSASKVETLSPLDLIIRRCGQVLGLEVLPEAYIAHSEHLNAFTFGRDREPILVITSAALNSFSRDELTALVGHELAHIRSKHLLYHTLAESIARGASLLTPSLGLGFLSMPIQMILLAWYKESEISADRAGTLVVDDPGSFKSLITKLSRSRGHRGESSEGAWLSRLFETHPESGDRLKMAEEFVRSRDYLRAIQKVRRRDEVSKALVPACKFCGVPKRILDFYCPVCKRSQL